MIELRILGAFDLRTAEGRALDEALRRSKRIALLAYVASARPFGFHRRDKLAALFWPDLDKERSRGALRTTLSRLRDDLGDDVVESRGAEEIAVRRDRLWCDVAALYACLDHDDAVGAADLYGGTMLDGVHIPGTSDEFEQWISEARTNIRTGLIGALSTQVDRLVASGESAQALVLAQRAGVIAPDDEAAARQLIQVALFAGDRGAALRAYEAIERVLRREYDVSPSDETAALVAPLRGAAATEGPAMGKPAMAVTRQGDDPPAVGGASEEIGSGRRDQRRVDAARPGVSQGWRRRMLAVAAATMAIAGTWQLARVGMMSGTAARLASGSWRQFESSAGSPPARHFAAATVDSSGDGLLVVGGARSTGDRLTLEPIGSEEWRLVGLRAGAATQWVRIPILPGPSPKSRWMFGAAFDAPTDRWFVHGGALGWSAPCANDTWVLERASGMSGQPEWRSVAIRGALPPPRAGFQLALDRSRRKLIVFGGNDCVNEYFHDTWVLTFDDSTFASGAWSHLLPDSSEGRPVTRNGHAAIYDASSARLFVFGGMTPQRRATSELWVLDHADGESGTPRWHALACAGDAPALVSPASTYDAAHDSWMFFGGTDAAGSARRDLWRVDRLMRDPRSCQWTHVPFTEPWPLARSAGMAASLHGGTAFLLFGGYVETFSVRDAWVFTDSVRR